MAPPGPPSTIRVTTPAPAEAIHRPDLRTIVRRVSSSLLIACVVPVSLFYAFFAVAGLWAAMAAALGWSYGAIAWRALTGRRTSGLLILTAIVLTGRTAVALAADSAFLYFLQPIISDGVVGATFLLSLVSARPIVARLAGDFYPMDHELSLRPRIRRLFQHLTAFWATLCLGKALAMFWVLESQPLETFVLVQSVSAVTLNSLAACATLAAAVVVGRKEGLIGPARGAPVLIPA